MKLAFVAAIAVLTLPAGMLKSAASGVSTNFSYAITICDRHPDECEALRQSTNAAASYLTEKAIAAGNVLFVAYRKSKEQAALGLQSHSPDRGTLTDQDLQPVWRGHQPD